MKNNTERAELIKAGLISSTSRSRINSEVSHIISGCGWATDEYIENFSTHLTRAERIEVMKRLALEGLLYEEEKVADDEKDRTSPPSTGRVTVAWVEENYSAK